MKFSIILPVYNVEKYIAKCLESIKNQTYKNYEVIIINDGSKDNSQNIIDNWMKENPQINVCAKIYSNAGLSEARNRGVKLAKGEYIFFIDSDDYIDNNLLEVVNFHIEREKNVDLYRIPKRIVYEDGTLISQDKVKEFSMKNGEEAFIKIRKNRITLETAWAYLIKREYWLENNFKFAKGLIHEDLGLMPWVIIKARSVSAINYPYYYYVKREGSITTTNDYEKKVKKAYDVLKHYDFLIDQINKTDIKNKKSKKMYMSYITDGVIGNLKRLQGNEYKKYLKELKERNVIQSAKIYSIKSLVKKILYIYILYQK